MRRPILPQSNLLHTFADLFDPSFRSCESHLDFSAPFLLGQCSQDRGELVVAALWRVDDVFPERKASPYPVSCVAKETEEGQREMAMVERVSSMDVREKQVCGFLSILDHR